jgi:hypothetical protein
LGRENTAGNCPFYGQEHATHRGSGDNAYLVKDETQLSGLADFRWVQACIIAFLTLKRTQFLIKTQYNKPDP